MFEQTLGLCAGMGLYAGGLIRGILRYQAGEFLTCCFALRLEFYDFRKINFLSQVNSGSPLANKARTAYQSKLMEAHTRLIVTLYWPSWSDSNYLISDPE